MTLLAVSPPATISRRVAPAAAAPAAIAAAACAIACGNGPIGDGRVDVVGGEPDAAAGPECREHPIELGCRPRRLEFERLHEPVGGGRGIHLPTRLRRTTSGEREHRSRGVGARRRRCQGKCHVCASSRRDRQAESARADREHRGLELIDRAADHLEVLVDRGVEHDRGRVRPDAAATARSSSYAVNGMLPIARSVCFAKCRARSGSVIGVDRCVDIVGCRSRRYTMPSSAAKCTPCRVYLPEVGLCEQQRYGLRAEDVAADLEHAPDAADRRRRVGGRARRVLHDPRTERPQRLEHGSHLGVEVAGAERARDTGDADHVALFGGALEHRRFRQADEQARGPAAARELQQRVDAAGEVVTVEGGSQSRHGSEPSSRTAGARPAPSTARAPQRSRGPSDAHCTASDSAATAKILRSQGNRKAIPWMISPMSA